MKLLGIITMLGMALLLAGCGDDETAQTPQGKDKVAKADDAKNKVPPKPPTGDTEDGAPRGGAPSDDDQQGGDDKQAGDDNQDGNDKQGGDDRRNPAEDKSDPADDKQSSDDSDNPRDKADPQDKQDSPPKRDDPPPTDDSFEKIIEETIALFNEATESLNAVNDGDTAKLAGDELKALADRLKKLDARWKALGEPSEEKARELDEKYGPAYRASLGDAGKSAVKASGRLFKSGGAKAVGALKDAFAQLKDAAEGMMKKDE